jgi:NAD(P)-dependent dehydrogenase (short-subunit alcohol dehydrogenase family)
VNIDGSVAVVTGAGSGIGHATATALVAQGARGVAMVDHKDAVLEAVKVFNDRAGRPVAHGYVGDVTDRDFRRATYDDIGVRFGVAGICVPAAGVTRDALAVRLDKASGKAIVYPEETFRLVTEVNLMAPVYWALEMVARIAEDRHRKGLNKWDPKEGVQGTAIFIGSVSSQGNKGQIAYAATKRGLEGAARTLMKEAMFFGVRTAVLHPGFTDTPMVRAMGQDYVEKNVIPFTQLKRLIAPEEIASAICFMITNTAVSGEMWCDAGWHPSA